VLAGRLRKSHWHGIPPGRPRILGWRHASFAHRDEVEVVYRSFELDPGYPKDRQETTFAMLGRKYGMSEADAHAAEARIAGLAAAEGLGFALQIRALNGKADVTSG
jgi:predicted DsbA family dithiol-disulfide isomerase